MNIRNFFITTISTFFYVGYLPFIPGTFGSCAGLWVFFLVKNNVFVYISVIVVSAVLGFVFSGQAEKLFNKRDPRYVVIDEVVGILLTFLFLPYYDMKLYVIGFFLFRLLDTLKPYPAGWLQRLDGSKGIMGDDIVAGLYTNCILQVVARFSSATIS